jgi:hypothetical protein
MDNADGSATSAERAFRNGDCYAGIESAVSAFQEYGEARGHRDALPSSNFDKGVRGKRWIVLGTRLNFLRQAMKRCVR